ncbi:hypothetical protein IPF37_06255 [bacterium]|nr:MAG: hypothetical protein IPF37_06255 [bacterium]
MKKNNGLALVGLVLTFVSTDLNAGVTSRVRDFFFGPPRETSTAHPVTRNAQVEQYRRQLEQDVEMQGPSVLRQKAPTPHGTQEYFTPPSAPQNTQVEQHRRQLERDVEMQGPSVLRRPAPTHATPAPAYTTQQASQFHPTSKYPESPGAYHVPPKTVSKINQETPRPSQYAAPQTVQPGQPQPKQSIFGRTANKVANILKPKKEEIVISNPRDFRSNKDKILNQSEFRELKAADEAAQAAAKAAARERAIPPKPTYSPPPRPQQPAAFSNDIPSQSQLSQTPAPSAPTPPQRPTRYINVPAAIPQADAPPLPPR